MPAHIDIISPDHFKTVPWKNGLGETIELAINEGGTLANFNWRLSMASVVEDGVFSNFEHYTRHLILIEGNGINLQHNANTIDKLTNILDMATFDGGNTTVGNLHAGDITDFNIITRTQKVNTQVVTHKKASNDLLETADMCFIYSLYRDVTLTLGPNNQRILPAKHLTKIIEITEITENTQQHLNITGDHIIIVYLTEK